MVHIDVVGCPYGFNIAVMRDKFTSFRLTKTISSYVVPALFLVFLLIGLNGCHRLLPTQHAADPVLHGILNDHPIEHVVVFAVDGLSS